ncbi:CSC1-like protein RXW8 [Dichanthelium oligosanthes]|uniref:CSC1-like protein RXW8 n=1 Tax=Dichanthelium oligosanthes TaxID=888268 RepID=A0A1E5W2G6_9POAL|nr:CSC1-like protein RXW8 [Dichanthelium oligosanthes]
MKVGGLLTSAGINIGLCVLFLSLYSILRKQPQNVKVYFGRRIAEEHNRLRDAFILERFVPSPSWIVKSLRCTEDEILATAGLDAVVFNRILVFREGTCGLRPADAFIFNSMRIFSLAAILCVFGVLPLNYFGQDMHHDRIPSASLETFTIGNMQEKSRWLWVHCVVLYIISGVACVLLYLEYKHIARLRLCHISRATSNPSYFTVLVRGIPKSSTESFSRTVESFFTKYHASSYLSHQVVYKVGKVQKIVSGAKKVYRKFRHFKGSAISQLNALSSPKKIPTQLARAVPVQFLNVYCTKYDTGGLYWPIAHNTTIFSLVLTQIICLGVFGLKESPVAAGFTVPLIIFTLLFNQYCRKRHLPLFKTFPAQNLIDMDKEDQQMGRAEDLHERLHSAYFQFADTDDIPLEGVHTAGRDEDESGTSGESSHKESADDDTKDDLSHPTLDGLPVSRLRNVVRSLSTILRPKKRELPV